MQGLCPAPWLRRERQVQMVEEIVLQTGETPEVLIPLVGGDLRLTGWERPEFFAEGESGTLSADFREDRLTFEGRADATVKVPRNATVTIQQIGGDARLKSLAGALRLDRVGGDLTLRKTGAVRIGRVSGDLSARRVDGDLLLEGVTGDVSAREVRGQFSADHVSGDLYLGGSGGGAEGQAGGDVTLNLSLIPHLEYNFSAGGDLTCRIQRDASAQVTLHAGRKIVVQLETAPSAEQSAGALPDHTRQFTLGSGEAQLDLRAGGSLLMAEDGTGWDPVDDPFGNEPGKDFARRLSAEINQQINEHLNASLKDFPFSGGEFGAVIGEAGRKVELARQKLERARERIERKTEQARRDAERRVEHAHSRAEHARRARQRAERGPGRKAYSFQVDAGRKPGGDPVADEERLMILHMVEEGKINVQEAEKLLAALEASA